MKIVLVNPSTNLDKSLGLVQGIHSRTTMMPLNLGYLAAYLLKHEIEVEIIDAYTEGLSLDKVLELVKRKRVDVVGISSVTPTIPFTHLLAKKIKEVDPKIWVVAGGAHPSSLPEEVLKNRAIDFVVRNEGEETFLELVKTLESGKNFSRIKGISYFNKRKVVHNKQRDFIKNLDKLPMPAFELMPMGLYRAPSHWDLAFPAFQMLTSRGCPFRCTFCSVEALGKKTRVRSIENVIKEIELLVRKYKAKEIMFVDPTFPLTKERGLEFCEKMIESGLSQKVIWVTETRVDLVDRELLAKMYESGCRLIAYGIESGSQKILDQLQKGFKKDKACKALELTREAGILSYATFILGSPKETKEQMEETIEFAKEIEPDYVKFNLAVPYPGSAFYQQVKDEGGLSHRDWEEFTSFSSMTSYEPVYVPSTMSSVELEAIHRKAYRSYYLRPRIILKNLKMVKNFSNLRKLIGLVVVFVNGVFRSRKEQDEED